MADQAIPAINTTPASTDAAVSTQQTCSTSLEKLMAYPANNAVQVLTDACQAVRANEEARLAAQKLSGIQNGNNQPVWTPLTSEGMEEDTRYRCPSLGYLPVEQTFAGR